MKPLLTSPDAGGKTHDMKSKFNPLLIAIATGFLFVGCAKRQTSQMPPPIREAMQRYHAISPSMSRADVYRAVGQPQKTSADGVEQWRTSDGRQVAVLSVTFKSDETVASSEAHVDDPGEFAVQR